MKLSITLFFVCLFTSHIVFAQDDIDIDVTIKQVEVGKLPNGTSLMGTQYSMPADIINLNIDSAPYIRIE
ncbi:MAG: hypothetical protein EOP51_01130 [Sphingobacteriales bacterium]|nr:MAG: hypothetical protein EOP51_01130 [Sphingobacteriales bacterium]